MGHINIQVDANAVLALQQAAGQRHGRTPTVPELWDEMILFLQQAGRPPEGVRGDNDQVLEFEIVIR